MNRYHWQTKSSPYFSNFIEAETAGKAKYKLWLNGACDIYDDFKSFLKDVKIIKISDLKDGEFHE